MIFIDVTKYMTSVSFPIIPCQDELKPREKLVTLASIWKFLSES
jgi:hypothetical protein